MLEDVRFLRPDRPSNTPTHVCRRAPYDRSDRSALRMQWHNGPATPTAVQDSRSATWTLWRSDPASSWRRSDISSVVGLRRQRGRTDRDGSKPGSEETGFYTRVQGHRSATNGTSLHQIVRLVTLALHHVTSSST